MKLYIVVSFLATLLAPTPVDAAYLEMVAAAPAQVECLTKPSVEALEGGPRAAYAPDTAILYVRPGEGDRLVLLHELAHHLDFLCDAQGQIGAAFREAQGIAPGKAWWMEGPPVTWPAEYFANAVAVAMGEVSAHGVTPEAVALVKTWMEG